MSFVVMGEINSGGEEGLKMPWRKEGKEETRKDAKKEGCLSCLRVNRADYTPPYGEMGYDRSRNSSLYHSVIRRSCSGTQLCVPDPSVPRALSAAASGDPGSS